MALCVPLARSTMQHVETLTLSFAEGVLDVDHGFDLLKEFEGFLLWLKDKTPSVKRRLLINLPTLGFQCKFKLSDRPAEASTFHEKVLQLYCTRASAMLAKMVIEFGGDVVEDFILTGEDIQFEIYSISKKHREDLDKKSGEGSFLEKFGLSLYKHVREWIGKDEEVDADWASDEKDLYLDYEN